MYTKPEYLSAFSTAATIYREGGVFNFWRGLIPRMTRIIGASTLRHLVTHCIASCAFLCACDRVCACSPLSCNPLPPPSPHPIARLQHS